VVRSTTASVHHVSKAAASSRVRWARRNMQGTRKALRRRKCR